jgi:hypothetical protein
VLKKSMAGLGTDEATLIRTLAFKDSHHLRDVHKVFNEKYGAKGNLIKWIEGSFSSSFFFSSFLLSFLLFLE